MREALLIIDVQNDYFPGGANELVHPYEAEKKIQELIADSRATIPSFWKEQKGRRFQNGSGQKRETKSSLNAIRTAFWKRNWMRI